MVARRYQCISSTMSTAAELPTALEEAIREGCPVPLPQALALLSSAEGAELCRCRAQCKRPFRGAHQNQEEKPFCAASSCQRALLRTPSIMPEGKMQMFTGFGSVITEQALKSGFGAERSLTDISRLVLNHLRDISAWMSERRLRITRSQIDQCPGSPPKPLPALFPCSCSGSNLQVTADSHFLQIL